MLYIDTFILNVTVMSFKVPSSFFAMEIVVLPAMQDYCVT